MEKAMEVWEKRKAVALMGAYNQIRTTIYAMLPPTIMMEDCEAITNGVYEQIVATWNNPKHQSDFIEKCRF